LAAKAGGRHLHSLLGQKINRTDKPQITRLADVRHLPVR